VLRVNAGFIDPAGFKFLTTIVADTANSAEPIVVVDFVEISIRAIFAGRMVGVVFVVWLVHKGGFKLLTVSAGAWAKRCTDKCAPLKTCAVNRLIFPSTRQMALIPLSTDAHGMFFILCKVKPVLLKRVRFAEPVGWILLD
jgi:hypothetical protein